MKPEIGDLVLVIANKDNDTAAGKIGIVLSWHDGLCERIYMVKFNDFVSVWQWGYYESRLIVLSHTTKEE